MFMLLFNAHSCNKANLKNAKLQVLRCFTLYLLHTITSLHKSLTHSIRELSSMNSLSPYVTLHLSSCLL